MGATHCPFPAFCLVSTNAMVEGPHGGPHLFPFVAVCPGAFQPCLGLISGVSNTRRLCLPFSVLVLRGKCTVGVQSHIPQSPVKVIRWPHMRWEELIPDGMCVESAIHYAQSGGCRGGKVVGFPEWVPRFVPSPLSSLFPPTPWLKVRTVDHIFFLS